MTEFESGGTESTSVGYINRNNQRCGGQRGKSGTDHMQLAYLMQCLEPGCANEYGANGTDVFQRKCPNCQGGAPSIEF